MSTEAENDRIKVLYKESEGMNRIREIMLLKRITQQDLSKRTGIKQSELSKIINGRKAIHLSTAKRIAKALGVSVDYLWPD